MSIENVDVDEETQVIEFDSLDFSKGPTKKDMEEIEQEFSDVLESNETSQDDSRFTKHEMEQIDNIVEYIEEKRKVKGRNKEISELEKLTAQEYAITEQQENAEDYEHDDNMGVEEISLDDLENFEEVSDFYN